MPGLASTPRGRAWLGNFDLDDQPIARRLLDSVELVSDSSFRREMKSLLARARGDQTESVVAAYAVHNLPRRFDPHYFGCGAAHSRITPLVCTVAKHTGSEAIVQNILLKSGRTLGFSVDSSTEELHTSRVRRILLVTDNVATGQEVETFIAYMRSNRRLRSWESFGWLRFELVTHSISEAALLKLNQSVVVHFEQLSRTFDTSYWNAEQADEVRLLCRKYGSIKREALGRGNAESLQVFGHTFGNGTPSILRQRFPKKDGPWMPLLPHDRDYALDGEEMLALENYQAPHKMVDKLRSLVQRNRHRALRLERIVANSQRGQESGINTVAILALLTAIESGNARPVDLMKAGAMSLSRLHTVARAAHDFGLIDGYEELVFAIDEGALGNRTTHGRLAANQVHLAITSKGKRLMKRRGKKAVPSARAAAQNKEKKLPLEIRMVKTKKPEQVQPATTPQTYYPEQLR